MRLLIPSNPLLALAVLMSCMDAAPGTAGDVHDFELIDSANQAYYREKNWTNACSLFARLADANPARPEYAVRLGFSHFRNESYPEAITAFRRALEIGPWPSIYNYQIACSYARMGDNDAALEWLQKSIEAGWPDYAELAEDKDFLAVRGTPEFRRIFGKRDIDTTSMTARWLADLDFMKEKIELLHHDPYRLNPPKEWAERFDSIKVHIPKMTEAEIIVSMMRFAALAGEGHTKVLPNESGPNAFHSLPLELYDFKNGIFVRGATSALRLLVGAKVVAIGGIPIDTLFARSERYRGHDNAMHHRKMSPRFLVMVETLRDMGARVTDGHVSVRVMDEQGRESEVEVEGSAIAEVEQLRDSGWIVMNDGSANANPWYLKDLESDFWFTADLQSNAMYAHIRYIVNNDDTRFSGFVDSVFAAIDQDSLPNLILDLRNCGGGNSDYNKYLVAAILQRPGLNEEGRLFAIIGRDTYSAAMNLVSDLEYRTHVIFIGEPTGTSPNFIGESTVLHLPYSGLPFVVSNRYHQGGANNSLDKRPWVAPALQLEITSEQFRDNEDPVVETILDYIRRK